MGSKRFKKILKSKEFKLSLLCATTFAFLLASGQSFAKYYEENYNEQGAGIAKIGSANLYFNYEMNQTPKYLAPLDDDDTPNVNESDAGFYAFMAEFRIEFGSSEVSREFSLDLKMAKSPDADYNNHNVAKLNSFVLPTGAFENGETEKILPTFITRIDNGVGTSYKVENALNIGDTAISRKSENSNIITTEVDISLSQDTNRAKWDNAKIGLSALGITSFKKDTLYYSYSTNYDSDINPDTNKIEYSNIQYKWGTKTLVSSGSTMVTDNLDFINKNIININEQNVKLELGKEEKTFFFQMIFFSKFDLDENDELVNESSKILYQMEVSQVGGAL